jgi:hypothetical protein
LGAAQRDRLDRRSLFGVRCHLHAG